MKLKDIFVDIARKKGIRRIYAPGLESSDPLAFIASQIACGRIRLCKAHKVERICLDLEGRLLRGVPDAYAGNCGEEVLGRDELMAKAKDFPHIAIDASFPHLHNQKELRSLQIQLKATLGVVRRYMWDERLAVCGIESELSCPHYPNLEDFLRDKDIDKVLLLDPSGEEVFTGQRAECYVVGGIVDKAGNKKGLTSEIGKRLEKNGFDVVSTKILLKGDVVGVPDRINHIVEILLLTVLDGMDIGRAIKAVQTPTIAKWRLRQELPRLSFRIGSMRAICRSEFSHFDWLNVSEKDFYEVTRQLQMAVLSEKVANLVKVVKSKNW